MHGIIIQYSYIDCTVMSCFTSLAYTYIIIIVMITDHGLDLKGQLIAPNNYKLYTYLSCMNTFTLGRGDVHRYDVEVYCTIDKIVV